MIFLNQKIFGGRGTNEKNVYKMFFFTKSCFFMKNEKFHRMVAIRLRAAIDSFFASA